jgi:hypothetical protein
MAIQKTNSWKFIVGCVILVGTLLMSPESRAQMGPSFSIGYDVLPYQGIDGPIEMPDGSLVDDAEVRLGRFRATMEYPTVYSQGRTMLIHKLAYQRIQFDYRNTSSLLDRLHSVGYSMTVYRVLSEKWSAIVTGKASLASDLEVDLAIEDFSFQTAAIFNRHFSDRLTMGFGAAFSTQFGSGEFIPLLSIDWNNGGKWSMKAVLPASLELWYDLDKRVKLGLLATGDGENFRFDPGSYEDEYPEPNLRYTMLTVGPAARIGLSDRIQLNAESGVVGLHRFEFYSGDDEVVSNDLKSSWYVRLGLESHF